jgi:heme A synthase
MKKLAWITVFFTFFLMVWGNIVSSTGSGLACPDWPLCHGTITPAFSKEVFLEWGHRLLAFTASCLILATVTLVLVRSKGPGSERIKRSGRTLLVLLGAQVLLGATTVLLGLSPAVSTIHLIIANVVFCGLITVASVLTWGNPVIANPSGKVRRLAVAGMGAMIIQLALGGLVRHTHSGLACPNFPMCLDGFLPIPFTFETAIAFAHRWWGVILLGVFIHLTISAFKESPALGRAARNTMALAVAQIFLGIGTVQSGLNTHSRATHAAVGYLLWGSLFYVALRSGGFRWLWDRKPGNDASSDSPSPIGLTPVKS